MSAPPSSVPSRSREAAVPVDLLGREAIVAALDLLVRELRPLAASFAQVDAGGQVETVAARGPRAPELGAWEAAVPGVEPAALDGRVVRLRDREQQCRRLGVVDDVRLPLRDGGPPVALIALWRELDGPAWSARQLRLLEVLQPLIELAYLTARRAASTLDERLPGTLTERQREVARLLATGASNTEVARALVVSPNTAKSHARAVLAKLGVTSRRELVVRLIEQSSGDPQAALANAPKPRRDAIRAEGDEAPRRLLALVLDWANERVGGAIGGCALFSAHLELVAEARALATGGPEPVNASHVRRVQQLLLPPAQPAEIVGHLVSERAQSPVVQLDVSGAGDDRLGELVAKLGLTAPLLTVLRLEGRVAGLVWIARDARVRVTQREAASALRVLHTLLELAYTAPLAASRTATCHDPDLGERGLTARELAVARLVLGGHSNAAIAERLGITESTVKHHMTRILAKCGVRSRTQLIAQLRGDG